MVIVVEVVVPVIVVVGMVTITNRSISCYIIIVIIQREKIIIHMSKLDLCG